MAKRIAVHTYIVSQTLAASNSPNIQTGKYNEIDPILIGTAVSEVSYTDFIALVPSRQTFVGRERA